MGASKEGGTNNVGCALVLCLWLGFIYGRHLLVGYAPVLFLELVGWLREL